MIRRGRAAAIAIGGGFVLSGLLLQFRPDLAQGLLAPLRQPGAGPILLGTALIVASLFEGRYRGSAAAPGPGWERTGEVFRDEESGRPIRVWYHPASGERRYVPGDETA